MRRLLLASLTIALAACPEPEPLPDPGEYVVHRLNRAEYDNTVRDLLGTTQTPARDFPADDHGYGFDNIGAALSMSPLHVELYERAAGQLVAEALADPEPWPLTLTVEAEEAGADVGADWGLGWWNLTENGELAALFDLPGEGTWQVSTRVFGHAAAGEPARLSSASTGWRSASTTPPSWPATRSRSPSTRRSRPALTP